jgi:hypothetical protein
MAITKFTPEQKEITLSYITLSVDKFEIKKEIKPSNHGTIPDWILYSYEGLRAGDKFTITHSDGYIANETVLSITQQSNFYLYGRKTDIIIMAESLCQYTLDAIEKDVFKGIPVKHY